MLHELPTSTKKREIFSSCHLYKVLSHKLLAGLSVPLKQRVIPDIGLLALSSGEV